MNFVIKKSRCFLLAAALLFCINVYSNSLDSGSANLLKKIELADGSTDLQSLSSWINDAANRSDCRADLREILTAKIHDNNPIYTGRPFYTALRIKGYLMTSLSKTGLTNEAAKIVTGEIATGHDPYIIAAAIRAIASSSYHDTLMAAYLVKYLGQGFRDEWVDIENLELQYPLTSPTSVRLEAIKALEANALATPEITAALNAIALAKEGSYFYSDTMLINAATLALEKLSDPKSCCAKPGEVTETKSWQVNNASFASPWLQPGERNKSLPAAIRIGDQLNRNISFKKLRGKPLVIAFFYTRCTNPNKCSRTVTELGKLQQVLQQQSMENNVYTGLVSYDPEYDSPDRIQKYAATRGLKLDEQTLAMNIPANYLQELLKSFNIEANYDGSIVNIHDIQLLLFDKNNRFVRMYGQVIWDNNSLISDIKKLQEE